MDEIKEKAKTLPTDFKPIHVYGLAILPTADKSDKVKMLIKDSVPVLCHKVAPILVPKQQVGLVGSNTPPYELSPTYCTTACSRATICVSANEDRRVVYRQTCESTLLQFEIPNAEATPQNK